MPQKKFRMFLSSKNTQTTAYHRFHAERQTNPNFQMNAGCCGNRNPLKGWRKEKTCCLNCCTRTQTVTGAGWPRPPPATGWSRAPQATVFIGETWYQVDGSNAPTSAQGTLIEFTNSAGGTWVPPTQTGDTAPWIAVFRMNCEPDTQFTNGTRRSSQHTQSSSARILTASNSSMAATPTPLP